LVVVEASQVNMLHRVVQVQVHILQQALVELELLDKEITAVLVMQAVAQAAVAVLVLLVQVRQVLMVALVVMEQQAHLELVHQ
jgi:hypothetical protein